MKLCERCPVTGCCLDYLGEVCRNVRQKEAPGINPNNAEIISNLSVEEMAAELSMMVAGMDRETGTYYESILKWLKSEE